MTEEQIKNPGYFKNPDGSYMNREEIKKDLLANRMAKETIEEFANTDEKDLVMHHHWGLGIWIRNNYGLWAADHPNMVGYEAQLDDHGCDCNPNHPDNYSMNIVEELWRELNDSASRVSNRAEERLKKLL